MSKRLNPQWTDKHKQYMQKGISATISVAEGAVRAGKTVDNVTMFAKMIDLGVKDRIHLATGSTSANAKLNIGDCNGYGLEYIFRGRCRWTKYKGNDALLIKSHGRIYIVIFAGGSKSDSFKKIRGNSYGMWIATEINLHHPSMIKEAFNRQLAATTRRIFWDLNPSSPAHFIYKDYIDRFPEAYGTAYNYEHFTIRDNASITDKRIAEIEATYDKRSIWYKRDILGIRCNADGVIYDMFGDEHITDERCNTLGDLVVSSDYGIQNATTFLFWRQTADKKQWIEIGEYYYSGREEHKQKTVSELTDNLIHKWEQISTELGQENKIPIKNMILDPSATALKVELRKRGIRVRDGDNDVLAGIEDVSTALYRHLIAVHRSCTNTINEFGIYMWDEKASERGEDLPVKENDHCMDAVRYFVRTMKLVNRVDKGASARQSYLA